MNMGLSFALHEITLVLFTTLAPAGSFSCCLLSAFGLVYPKYALRFDRVLWFAHGLSLLGLILSATHLGNPDNAVFVIMHAGTSPLSNEVIAAVVFYGICGVLWLFSFSSRSPQQRLFPVITFILRVGVILSGLIFIHTIAFAYNVPTIQSWSHLSVPLVLWCESIVGGCALTIFSLTRMAEADQQIEYLHTPPRSLLKYALLPSSLILVVLLIWQQLSWQPLHNGLRNLSSTFHLSFPATICAIILIMVGLLMLIAGTKRVSAIHGETLLETARLHTLPYAGLSLMFFGLFMTRFIFYFSWATQ